MCKSVWCFLSLWGHGTPKCNDRLLERFRTVVGNLKCSNSHLGLFSTEKKQNTWSHKTFDTKMRRTLHILFLFCFSPHVKHTTKPDSSTVKANKSAHITLNVLVYSDTFPSLDLSIVTFGVFGGQQWPHITHIWSAQWDTFHFNLTRSSKSSNLELHF